jgi:predicted dehydrogenase
MPGINMAENNKLHALMVRNNDSIREEFKPYGNLYTVQVEHFGRCIDGQEAPIAPGIAGLKNIQITSAAYESARTGSIVGL